MSKLYNFVVSEDQLHEMYTRNQIRAVNQNCQEAARRKEQIRKDQARHQETAALRRQLRTADRKAKHTDWMNRAKKAVFFALLSIGSTCVALAGLADGSAAVSLGIGCGLYAAGVVGGLLRERKIIN